MDEQEMAEFINAHFDDFLHYYYKIPCPGCGHHNSFWATIIESEEWKAWKKFNNNQNWDWAECEELGIMSEGHFKAFIDFIKN